MRRWKPTARQIALLEQIYPILLRGKELTTTQLYAHCLAWSLRGKFVSFYYRLKRLAWRGVLAKREVEFEQGPGLLWSLGPMSDWLIEENILVVRPHREVKGDSA